MSRRTLLSILVPLVLLGAYFVVTTWVRAHVDALIQHAVGQPLPPFGLTDGAGKQWSLADLRGQRAVLHFFRSRCHVCELEAAAVRELEGNLPPDVVLLHVMTDAVLKFPAEETAKAIASKHYARPILMADATFVDAFHKVSWSNVTPVTYVVDAQGVVRYGLRGAQTRAVIEQALAAVK